MDVDRMKSLLMELCSVPSISETPGEIEMAEKIYEIIMRMDYFKNNPNNTCMNPIKNDPFGRYYVHALMEGESGCKKTVVLLSHFDVVNAEDYGAYKEYAFKPLEYTELLKKGS
ncbi:MAG: peptidase M20, partial [Clostridiaceae bacterium]|nr:peptidase M20 [Clostridiaceae bacterium]